MFLRTEIETSRQCPARVNRRADIQPEPCPPNRCSDLPKPHLRNERDKLLCCGGAAEALLPNMSMSFGGLSTDHSSSIAVTKGPNTLQLSRDGSGVSRDIRFQGTY